MKFIVIRVGDVKGYPPTISLISALLDLGHSVTLCTTLDSKGCEKSIASFCNIVYVDYRYSDHKSMMSKIVNLKVLRNRIWKIIDKIVVDDTILWIEDDITIKHLGYELLGYKYVIRLDELNESLFYTAKFKSIHMDTAKIGNNALAVVVPEYNRAHITKIWWELDRLPYVLPNKPYLLKSGKKKFELPKDAKEVFTQIGDRKVVLYQGGLGLERPIEPFVRAVDDLDDYAFVIMSSDKNALYEKYKSCYFINYIQAPYHLKVTELAYIGVIAYQPDKKHNSLLNTVYCAPNKVYEYGRFGLPILSNDLPGLEFLFRQYKSGISVDVTSRNKIVEAIKNIEGNYNSYSQNALQMYNDVDIKKIVNQIVEDAAIRINI